MQKHKQVILHHLKRDLHVMIDKHGKDAQQLKSAITYIEALPDAPQQPNAAVVIRCACDFIEGEKPSPIHADWSIAPTWAQWWAVDPDGICHWFNNEPILTEFVSHRNEIAPHWSHYGSKQSTYDAINIPLGIDWRLLKEMRRDNDGAEGE